MKIYFYLLSTASILLLTYLGFWFGFDRSVLYIVDSFGLRGYVGFEAFSLGAFGLVVGLMSSLIGALVAIIILHKLSKKYFVGVRFGRTILLSLLTTFLLLFLYLLFWPK